MNQHELKTWDEFMRDVATGKKSFEVRRNDRGFEVGDTLLLKGWYPNMGQYSGEEIYAEITYMLIGSQWGVMDGFVVMGIKVLNCNFLIL